MDASDQRTLSYCTVYYLKGTQPKHWRARFAVISDPPTSGYSRVFRLRGDRRSTLFCPFSLESNEVPNDCGELASSIELPLDADFLVDVIRRRWEVLVRNGLPGDFETAAVVLSRLGATAPAVVSTVQEDRAPRGKTLDVERVSPVKRGGRRGAVVEFFLDGSLHSLAEASAVLDMTRSGVLSHLFMVNKEHGLGYEVRGDCARLVMPEDHDPFAECSASSAESQVVSESRAVGKP